MDIFVLMDMLGTIAFAISGALTAMHKRLDIFGILIIALVTAVGGGTLRDLLIGKTPVSWMLDLRFVYVILGSVVFTVVFRQQLKYLRKSLFLFDTIGIGLYTTAGVKLGLVTGLNPFICMLLGTMSACFGGVIRDILCNEIPVVFRKEIYATACILGGGVYLLLTQFNLSELLITIVSGITVIGVRLLAVLFNLQLPSPYKRDPQT